MEATSATSYYLYPISSYTASLIAASWSLIHINNMPGKLTPVNPTHLIKDTWGEQYYWIKNQKFIFCTIKHLRFLCNRTTQKLLYIYTLWKSFYDNNVDYFKRREKKVQIVTSFSSILTPSLLGFSTNVN